MNPTLPSTAVEKLVCQHGDFFCVGYQAPASKEGAICKRAMYPRFPLEEETKCHDCQAVPCAYHVLNCTKERCPHRSRRLMACLGRKHRSKPESGRS